MSSSHPQNTNDDDRSTGSANSTSSDFLQKLFPLNQISELLPNVANNLLGGFVGFGGGTNDNNGGRPVRSSFFQRQEEIGQMVFDAIPFNPFNGDTDQNDSSYQNGSTLPDFKGMDLDVPFDELSNVSPIGNVSRSDESDTLDRILGTMKEGLGKKQQQQQQQQRQQQQDKGKGDSDLNVTLPTLHSESSMGYEASAALDGFVFHSSSGKYEDDSTVQLVVTKDASILSWPKERSNQIKKRFQDEMGEPPKKSLLKRSRSLKVLLISLCVVLILALSIMIGALVPSLRKRKSKTDTVAESTAANATRDDFPRVSPSVPAMSPSRPLSLRPSLAWQKMPTEFPSPVTTISSPMTANPTQQPVFSWLGDDNERNEDDRDRESERLPQVRLDMGPMVGHTTHDTVTLWAYYLKPAIYLFEENYVLEIMLYDADGWVRTIDEIVPDRDRNNAAFATLTNLEPLTVYRYEMRIMDQIVGSGSFETAPPPTTMDGTTFEYLLASCMDRSEQREQKAWDAVPTIGSDGRREFPDFAILAGDTIYLQEGVDVNNYWGVSFDQYWYRNEQQRTEPHFAYFVSNTPIYAVWNNHDYGSEVADMNQVGKEESLRAWKSLWPNPDSPGSNIDNANGIYYSFYRGDVHFIVTDDHWNRDPNRGNRWGVVQTEWIRSELISSTATFKIVVLGSDVMERGWSSDLENIGATVTEYSINGVLFNAGDIHRNEYKQAKTGGFPYPVTQISSSGIAKVARKPFAKIAVDTQADDPMIRVRFFGAVTMEEGDTTWTNDPELVCSTLVLGEDRGKEHKCTETIRLSDLSVA